MTLREKIQESIINAGNNFYYDSEYSLNRVLDNATFPTAFMYLLQDSGIDRVGTQMLDKCNAQVVFSDLQDFDNTAITTDDIIEECILKARFWLSTLQQSSNLELVQITSTKRIYSTFDSQLCGYLVNVQIRERYENKDCTNQPLTILEMLSQHTQQVATETQLGHIRSGGDISVDEYGIVTVLNGGGGGQNGLSAYEIWLQAGNEGTEQDFLDSLKGEDGTNGVDGLSAYEIWLDEGNSGTVQDFLASLQGRDGQDCVGGKEWQLQFFNQANVIQLEATLNNIASFESGVGTDVGTIEVSNDGVTYTPLIFPFSPTVDTWYFKRSSSLVTGVYIISE